MPARLQPSHSSNSPLRGLWLLTYPQPQPQPPVLPLTTEPLATTAAAAHAHVRIPLTRRRPYLPEAKERMSADLFAEFNSLAQSSPPASQQRSPSSEDQPLTSQAQPQDPFAGAGAAPASEPPLFTSHPPTQQWPSSGSQAFGPSIWGSANQPAQPAHGERGQGQDEDEDGWGDFEVAAPTAAQASSEYPEAQNSTSRAQGATPVPRMVRVPTIDLMTNKLVDVGPSFHLSQGTSGSQIQPRPPRAVSDPSDPNVLFDVDDFELQGGEGDAEDGDGDDFGDFETSTQPPPQPRPPPVPTSAISASMDLLGLDDLPQSNTTGATHKQPPSKSPGPLSFGASTSTRTTAPKSPSFQDRNPFPDLTVKTSSAARARSNDQPDSAVTPWPTAGRAASKAPAAKSKEDDDEWAAWDDMPAPSPDAGNGVHSSDLADNWQWGADEATGPSSVAQNDSTPPPINVPPPSVILSAFPDLFRSGDSLFKPIGQSTKIKQEVLSNPRAVQFLQGYVALGATAARVMAGRKHRWHRDKILAKSMSISAAGSKGMKLAGIDKTQSAREDREAADVVAAWREHVGRLRSAVATANSSGKASLKVPELSETMQVQTAKVVPTAPKPCIICGLKREERVTKVDFDVEDSFGEWWVEHWGHRACKNFWVEHEQRLRQR
ncbi:hypothetical protein PCL_07963 [Purpureocillium lilacinum]|uniref:Serine/threonine-protein kinase ppk6 n=2 Tax=Purpureocillium lilacinum TaxID=33203 RepID=A0A2U3EJG7_PURLI|nr:hypothetical protein Purlil1_2985 [Purpureocillium lilacinum]PWI74649.1 hypothetical protein PCL_07963 [Purpureocillium lilacinum]